MEVPPFSQPCRLMALPDELKLHIISYLDRRRDLYHLSRTCRVLEDVTMRRLYNNVDLEISPPATRMPGSPALRAPVTQSVRELTLRNGKLGLRKGSGDTGRRQTEIDSVETFVLDILHRVPTNQLSRFAFLHGEVITPQLLDTLVQRHDHALRHLSICEFGASRSQDLVPRNLKTFECRTVNGGEAVLKVISENKATLESLHLGQEKYIIDGYHRSRIGFLESIPQPLEGFYPSVYALDRFPRLRELCLHGLNLDALRPDTIPQALFLCRLEKLTLESCPGSAELLDSMSGTFSWASTSPDAPRSPAIVPSLKHFLFRHENPTNVLKDSVIRFLASFSGLETLSLLFENAALLERPSVLIAAHGPTLRTLVLESRIQPREHLGLDTSRPFGVGGFGEEVWVEAINDIARLCPNLIELGTGFPWNDEMIRLRKTLLPTLRHLKTIHIRNFPENQVFSQIGDYTIKEYALKFVEWVFPSLVGGARPALEHFAMGPTLYESRWKMAPSSASARNGSATPDYKTMMHLQQRQLPEFLRTHHFALDWAKTRFGRWSPLVTPVSEKCMEEICERKPLGRVFEQVWLR